MTATRTALFVPIGCAHAGESRGARPALAAAAEYLMKFHRIHRRVVKCNWERRGAGHRDSYRSCQCGEEKALFRGAFFR
jgi:hypothetical protein